MPAEDIGRILRAERTQTLARIATLTGEFDGIVAASADANTDDEHDPEGATIAFERAQVSALLDQARRHLIDLDRATAGVTRGDYGICERCGQAISPDRLAALASVRMCIACARRQGG